MIVSLLAFALLLPSFPLGSRTLGESCEAVGECGAGYICLEEVCSVYGGECIEGKLCANGQSCTNGKCLAPPGSLAEFSDCTVNSECLSGLFCTEKHCRNPKVAPYLPWQTGSSTEGALASVPTFSETAHTDFQTCVDIKRKAARGKCFDDFAEREGFQRRTVRAVAGRWKLTTGRSQIDDSPTVTLSLDANTKLIGSLGRAYRPTLFLRCLEGETEAYVVTGHSQHTESGNYDGATVTVRFDKEAAVTLNTNESTSGHAFFLPDPEGFMRRATMHRTMLFRFTPFSSSPQNISFNIAGLGSSLSRIAEACRWQRPFKQNNTFPPWYLSPL